MRSTLTGNKNLDIDILNQLDDKDLVSFCKTSKYANQLCNDQKLWLRRTIDRFEYIPLETVLIHKGDRKWSDYYIELRKNARIKTNIEKLLIDSSKIGRLDLVILALYNGAYIHYNNNEALRWASGKGHLDVVKYLISKGVYIHARNDDALIWASKNEHLEVVKYLVSQGADIHADDDLALRVASFYGHLEVVKYLVSKGADIHAKDDYALKNGTPNVIQYLKEQIGK